MIDIENCKRRDGGEFVIYSTDGKAPERPLIVGYKDSNGQWHVSQILANGRFLTGHEDSYDLVECHPLDGVEPGTPIIVWDELPEMAYTRRFVSVGKKGGVLARAYDDRELPSSWSHGLTLEQYAARYLK